jgi:hypothetical protein
VANTKREAILDAIKAKLVSLPGVAAGSVYRSRVAAFQRAQVPAVSVEWVSDNPANNVVTKLDWTLLVRIYVIVRGSVPDEVADPIVEDIHRKVMSDLGLGGLSMDIQPASVQNDINEADLNLGIVTMDFRVTYRTAEGDLT